MYTFTKTKFDMYNLSNITFVNSKVCVIACLARVIHTNIWLRLHTKTCGYAVTCLLVAKLAHTNLWLTSYTHKLVAKSAHTNLWLTSHTHTHTHLWLRLQESDANFQLRPSNKGHILQTSNADISYILLIQLSIPSYGPCSLNVLMLFCIPP